MTRHTASWRRCPSISEANCPAGGVIEIATQIGQFVIAATPSTPPSRATTPPPAAARKPPCNRRIRQRHIACQQRRKDKTDDGTDRNRCATGGRGAPGRTAQRQVTTGRPLAAAANPEHSPDYQSELAAVADRIESGLTAQMASPIPITQRVAPEKERGISSTGVRTGREDMFTRSGADNPCAGPPECADDRPSSEAVCAGCCSDAHQCFDHSAGVTFAPILVRTGHLCSLVPTGALDQDFEQVVLGIGQVEILLGAELGDEFRLTLAIRN